MGWVSVAGFIESLSNLSSRRYMCDGMKNRKGHVKKNEANRNNSVDKFLKSTRFSFWDFLGTTSQDVTRIKDRNNFSSATVHFWLSSLHPFTARTGWQCFANHSDAFVSAASHLSCLRRRPGAHQPHGSQSPAAQGRPCDRTWGCVGAGADLLLKRKLHWTPRFGGARLRPPLGYCSLEKKNN